ncbi:MAG: acyltransferase [Paracoccaceae bacterium]
MKTNIQALRFVAAVMVVMFHVVKSPPGDNAGSPIYDWFRYWGLAGVDVFFVISGFVMVWSQAHNPKPLGQFLRDRVIRIVPMYWLLTAVMALILYAVPQLFHSLSFDGDLTVASFTFTSWTVEKRLPLLYVGWTLEYELAFYLVFALAFSVLPLSLTPVPVAILLTAGAVFGPTTIIALEFVMGMIVGLRRSRAGDRPFRWQLASSARCFWRWAIPPMGRSRGFWPGACRQRSLFWRWSTFPDPPRPVDLSRCRPPIRSIWCRCWPFRPHSGWCWR